MRWRRQGTGRQEGGSVTADGDNSTACPDQPRLWSRPRATRRHWLSSALRFTLLRCFSNGQTPRTRPRAAPL